MLLSAQSILALCENTKAPLITPFSPEKIVISGKSAGLSSASYDCRIDHDLVLGVNPAHIIAEHTLENCIEWHPRWKAMMVAGDHDRVLEERMIREAVLADALADNRPMSALAYTVEDFCFPPNVSGAVCDKSSFARVFVSAFNTFFDPGFHGNATLELTNLGEKPVTYQKGDPVCQFLFTWLDHPTDRPYSGKYNHQTKAAHAARLEQADGSYVELAP